MATPLCVPLFLPVLLGTSTYGTTLKHTLVDDHDDDDDDDDDDDVDVDVDVDGGGDADGIDDMHPCHLYTYHPFHPSQRHQRRPLLAHDFSRGFVFSHSRFPFLRSSSPSPPVVRD